MKTRTCAIFVAVCLAVGWTTAALADGKKEISALYTKLEKAVVAKDIASIQTAVAPDFTFTSSGVTLSLDQLTSQMQQAFTPGGDVPKCRFTVISCELRGSSATAVTTNNTEVQIKTEDGVFHKLVAVLKSKDALRKTAAGWRIRSMNVSNLTLTMDGKPYDPK